jgi:hypothetical protein
MRLKNILPLLVSLGLVLFLLRDLFNVGFPQSHDGEMHLARLANLYLAVRDHHLPVRWAGNLNYMYGFPIFNFNYYLTELLAVPLFSLGNLSIEWSLKLVCMLAMLAAPLLWYFFLKSRFGRWPAFLAAVFAATAVYPWVNFLVRGSTGEVLAWPLLVLNLLLIDLFIKKPSRWRFLLLTGGLIAFLLCHNISVMFGLPLLIGFNALQLIKQPRRLWLVTGLSFLLAMGMSLFFWLPLILEQTYTIIHQVQPPTRFLDHFPTLWQLFFSKWGYGFSFAGPGDGLSFNLGPGLWLAVGLAVIAKKKDRFVHYFLTAFLVFLFFSLPISKWFWLHLPFIYNTQFPWRLLLFMSIAGIFLAGFAAKRRPCLTAAAAAVAVIYALINIHSQGFIHAADMNYFLYPFNTTTESEHQPQWFNLQNSLKLAEKPDKVFNAAGYQVNVWKTQEHVYSVTVRQDQPVFERTAYFPGWEVAVDGRPAPVIYEDADYPGLLGYRLSAGTHQVVSRFTDHTPARLWGDRISLLSLNLFGLIFIFFPKKLKLSK